MLRPVRAAVTPMLALVLTMGAAALAEGTNPARPLPDLGIGANLNGARPFSADSAWNQRVDHLPVRSDSDRIIGAVGPTVGLHPEFGSGLYRGDKIGIPYMVIPKDQPLVPILFKAYAEQADLGRPPYRYPIPPDAPIENVNAKEGSDRHVILVQRDETSPNGLGKLYELFQARSFKAADGSLRWEAYGSIFDMTRGDLQRPQGWTSADAAGLPIFPGLVRYEEVKRAIDQAGVNGVVPHAFRFTLAAGYTAHKLVAPAQHVAGWGAGAGPFGMRVRLKQSWQPPAAFRAKPELMVIANTLKTYGMIMADNGGSWFVTGAPDERWNNDDLHSLGLIRASDFEVVDTGPWIDSKP
jgi:hypothetical protein